MSYYTERDEALGDLEQGERDFGPARAVDPVVEEARKIAEAQGIDPRDPHKWRECMWLARRTLKQDTPHV